LPLAGLGRKLDRLVATGTSEPIELRLVKHASKRYDKPSFDRLHSLRSFELRCCLVESLLVRRLIN